MSYSPELAQEFIDLVDNGRVGTALVSETARVRVWHLHLKPGVRFNVHTHVLDYFWTIHSAGKARNYLLGGEYQDVDYACGDTKHFTFSEGERMTHSLENIGDTDLIFTTVEFKESANMPLCL